MNEMMRWRMIGYMAALFVAGAVTGAAVMARTAAGSQTLKVGRSEEIASLIRTRLALLNLTPEQKDKFEPWIRKASDDLEKSHLDCLQQCWTAVDTLHAKIAKELTPEQVQGLKQLDAERVTTMKKKYNFVAGSPAVGAK